MTNPQSNRAPCWGGALIALAAAAAYANSRQGAFVFDDPASIADNPSIRHLGNLAQVLRPPIDGGRTVGGRPLLNLSLALNYAWGGTSVRGYHLVNGAIHALAGLALYGVLRRTFRRIDLKNAEPAALAAALLWTVHPLQTEAVTYVVQRAESLMGLFYLLTLYAFIRGADRPPGRSWLTLSAAACVCGMATKEVMVSAPLVVWLYDCLWVGGSWRTALRERGGYYAALASTWVMLGALVAAAHGRGGSSGFGLGVSWPAYLLAQFPAVVHYLRLAFWPHPLIFDYGLVWAGGWAAAAGSIAVVGMLIAGTVWAWLQPSARIRALGWAGICFFAILAPTSLVPGGRMTLAEHRMYLALAPVLAVAVIALGRCLPRPAFFAASAGLALVGIGLTARRNRDYRSDLVLWRETVRFLPTNYFARNDLGGILFREGQPAAAIAQYAAASQLAPDYAEVQNNWGMVLAAGGQLPGAIERYRTALRLKPIYPEAELNLGIALVDSGRAAEALPLLAAALRQRPDYADADNDLGLAQAALGRWSEACGAYLDALRLDPGLAAAHNNLGNALMHLGQSSDAMAQYRAAVQLKPDYSEAIRNLGLAWVRGADWSEAQARFEQALRVNPRDFDAREDLGNVLRAQGKPADAAAQYRLAAQIDSARPEPAFNLGNALADLGRNDEAAAQYRLALRLAPGYAEAELNLGLVLATSGRRAEAIAACERALQINPNYAAAHNNLGNLLVASGRVEEAILHYEAAVRLEPGNADARENLAHALRSRQ